MASSLLRLMVRRRRASRCAPLRFILAPSQEHPKRKAAEGTKAGQPYKQGTYQNPLTIQVLTAPYTDAKADKDEEHRQGKVDEDWDIMYVHFVYSLLGTTVM